jgi:hypothetical protein
VPSLDLLLLPLLGGFVFAQKFNPTRYNTLRSAGNRLFFYAAISGVASLFLSILVVHFLLPTRFGQWLSSNWHAVAPFNHSGKATGAFLLGVTLWWPLNHLGKLRIGKFRPFYLLSEQAAVDRDIAGKSDPFETLLRRALGSGRQVSVTLRTGKVYIGKVATNFNPAHKIESISLVLSRSGHRDPVTQELTIDVDYNKTHQKLRESLWDRIGTNMERLAKKHPDRSDEELVELLVQELPVQGIVSQFETVVLVSEVISVGFFDDGIYEEYFRTHGTAKAKSGQQPARKSRKQRMRRP